MSNPFTTIDFLTILPEIIAIKASAAPATWSRQALPGPRQAVRVVTPR